MSTTDPAITDELDAIAASLIVTEKPKRKEQAPKPSKVVETAEPEDTEEVDEVELRGRAPEDDEDAPDDDEDISSDDADADEAPEDDEPSPDDDDQEDGDDEDHSDPLHTVKVDGKDTKVPLSELKRSYSGQQYIQQGMAQVANARKAVVEEVQKISQQRTHLSTAIDWYLQALGTGPERPSPQLKFDDPVAYSIAVIEYNEHQERVRAHQETQTRLQRENAEADASHKRQVMEAGRAYIAKHIPDYGHPEKGPVLRKALARTAEEYGFDDEDLREVADPRLIIALNELRRLKAREAKGKTVLKEKVEQPNVRPMIKPGAKRPAVAPDKAMADKARDRMHRTGDTDDVAAWLMTKPSRRR